MLVGCGSQLEGRLRARGEPIRRRHLVALPGQRGAGQSHLSIVLLQVQAAADRHPGCQCEGQSATAFRHGNVEESGRKGRKKKDPFIVHQKYSVQKYKKNACSDFFIFPFALKKFRSVCEQRRTFASCSLHNVQISFPLNHTNFLVSFCKEKHQKPSRVSVSVGRVEEL